MSLSIAQLNNLKFAAPYAIDTWKSTGVPPELIISQWAIESGWGIKSPGNNCFGIKEYPGCDGRQLLWTIEWFTPDELTNFLKKQGRTADLYPPLDPNAQQPGKSRYRCQDYFASFPTLADCFKKRAVLFLSSLYRPILQQYQTDGDIRKFIQDIAKIYSTSDPAQYTNMVLSIMSMPEVESVIKALKGA